MCDLEELSQIRSPIHSNVICKLQNPYLKLGNIGDAVNSVILINPSLVLCFVCRYPIVQLSSDCFIREYLVGNN